MAADLSDSSSDGDPISGINITPFVDVVLVLLVIFMVTAPALMKDSIGIQLPKASSGDTKTMQSVGIAITKQGQVLLNGTLLSDTALRDEIIKTVQSNPEAQAIISADGESKHSDVVRVIDIIKSSGLARFAIQIQKE